MRAAVIGLGRMGMRHVEILGAAGLEIVGLCDAQAAPREAAAAGGRTCVFDDPKAMLSAAAPKLVVVATTAPSHRALVAMAVEAGATHILCEKPLATSLRECDEIIALCDTAGVALAVNHQMRFMEQYTLPKTMAEQAGFGGLSSVTVVAGNFGMAMNGTHYFEMFRFVTGERPARVSAWFSSERVPNPRGAEFEDMAGSVRIETGSGKRFYLDCSADQGHGMHVVYAGRNGRITIDELSGELVKVERRSEHSALPTTRYGMPYDTERRTIAPADVIAPTRAVLDSLLRGENYPTGHDGRLAMEVLIAAHVSHERGGQSVELDQLPRDRRLPIA